MNDESLNVAAMRNDAVPDSASSEPLPLDAASMFIDLSSMSIIDVAGSEAETFLQGQFCNDMKLVKPAAKGSSGVAILNGYCTPKGRLLALPVVIGTATGFRLIVPTALEESLLKRLRMFVMRADVVFTARPDLILCGLQGRRDAWSKHLPSEVSLAAENMGVQGDADSQSLRWFDGDSGVDRWMLVLPAPAAAELRAVAQSEGGSAAVASAAHWTLGNIHAGVAEIGVATADAFIPQMLNLQQVGGLSFTKGCYPGQEIVARMQYLGKLKRHMVHLFLPSGAHAPSPGEAIGTVESEKAAEVVSSFDTGEGTHLLVVVRIGIELTTLIVDGHPCSPVELPYELAQPRSRNA